MANPLPDWTYDKTSAMSPPWNLRTSRCFVASSSCKSVSSRRKSSRSDGIDSKSSVVLAIVEGSVRAASAIGAKNRSCFVSR